MIPTSWHHDEILERFRSWLAQTAEEIDAVQVAGAMEILAHGDASAAAGEALPETGLLQVVEALTAMRHELKLQTRNGRSLEEAVQGARQSLDVAMRQFQSVQAREAESARRAAQPLVEALVGLDESLERGMKALEITCRQLTEAAPQELRQTLDDDFRRLRWWRRWMVRAWHARTQAYVAAATASVTGTEFARLREGYQLIHSRIQQELQKQGVRRVVTVGQRVDPTCMTVVELADDDQMPPETVVAELRPGYLWHQDVIRFAEVRAVKHGSRAAPANDEGAGLLFRDA
jgi:molecular chaperone GrpE